MSQIIVQEHSVELLTLVSFYNGIEGKVKRIFHYL